MYHAKVMDSVFLVSLVVIILGINISFQNYSFKGMMVKDAD